MVSAQTVATDRSMTDILTHVSFLRYNLDVLSLSTTYRLVRLQRHTYIYRFPHLPPNATLQQ